MLRTIPRVEDGRLYQAGSEPIVVGTPTWYAWLEHHTMFLFTDPSGVFTAHKSGTDAGSSSWEAFHTHTGKRYRLRLGPSFMLSQERLLAAAQAFVNELVPAEPISEPSTPPAASLNQPPKTAVDVGPPTSLRRTKLFPPRISSDSIVRPRLIERLHAGLNGKVTLISAPAGFGKTTLLVQWMRTISRPTAWLTLDENDNALPVFLHSLTAALQHVLPDACQATASLLQSPQFPSADHVTTLLINDLADVPEDVVVVLDATQSIHASEVHSLLDQLISHLPSQLHMVLVTQVDPPLPLARWRAEGYLNELRSPDLRFTLPETQAFLTRILGNDLAHEAAEVLMERAEGWIAVLRLAALSLRNASDHAAFLKQLRSSTDQLVSNYLMEEILAKQAPVVQEWLIRMSILEQFCAELCAATLGREAFQENVWALLDWLERSNMFLIPLDEHHGWYRFYPLFKQLLEQRLLAHVSREEIATLHRRASAWYATQGQIEEAIKYVLAAGDESGAVQLVEAQSMWVFEQEQWVQMERWLHLLPEEQIQNSPGLLVMQAWILFAHGKLQDLPYLLTNVEQLLRDSGSDAGEPDEVEDLQLRSLHAMLAILWSAFQFFTGQGQASLENAHLALKWIPPGQEFLTSNALMYLALSNQLTGHEDVALVELQQALREQPASLPVTCRLLFAHSLVYLAEGKFPQLEHTARYFLRLTQMGDLEMSHYFAHWLLGIVYYEWNQLDTAVYHFSAVIANQHLAHFWVVMDSMFGLASAYQAQGLDTRAKETARAVLELTQEQHNTSYLKLTYAFHGHLALLQGEMESAAQWLDMAGGQDMPGPIMYYYFEDQAITRARLLLAKGDASSVKYGQAILAELLQRYQAIHSTPRTVKLLALQALAYNLQGRLAEALTVLESAITLARPGAFVRIIADLPQLATLLQELRKRRKAYHMVNRKLDAYFQRILMAMSPSASRPDSMETMMRQEGLEPLTGRELHILRLLEKGLTIKEMARELVVTPGTIKAHTNNIYRKLRVNNRRAAISLTKTLGLLPESHPREE